MSCGQTLADCLDSYLREIATLPLLTPAEERRLARRIARGDEAARRQLVSANLRLVVKLARPYAAYGQPLCDLIQEGNLGLIKAAERFDWQRGTRFGTYAAYWIREAITRALTTSGRAVRLSGHAFKRFRKLTNKAEELTATYLREPTLSEVAAAMEITPTQAGRILSAAAFPVPLNGFSDGEHGGTSLEEIACECGCDPAELVPTDPTPDEIRRAMDTLLDSRERWIVAHSYGFDGDPPERLKEMAEKLGLSLERVRQLRGRALRKLRRHLASTLS